MSFRTVNIRKNKRCPVCGEHPLITELREAEQPACDLKTKSANNK
jgi:adenylyltransferase/sulfurtransferase